MHCAACGYLREHHDLGTLRCPIETADKNGRRGSWREPPPIDRATWREILARDAARQRAELEEARRPYIPVTYPPPAIPARPPYGPHEYATSNRGLSAVKLGRAAMEAGWEVSPWYWMAYDWSEGCALRLAKGPLRAVATWAKKGDSWTTDVAYAWRIDAGRMPTKLTHTQLEELIK